MLLARRITGDHDNVAGPGCIIQSSFGSGHHGNFEVIVPLQLNDSSIELRHFFRNSSDVRLPWTRAQFITQSCAGLGGIIQSSFGSAGHGSFEVIVDERRITVPSPAAISPRYRPGVFNVPLDRVSWNGSMYIFFSTDCRQAGVYALMGRSVLTRSSNNGLDFTPLYEVSHDKFINVSTMIVDAHEHGLPGTGPQLVIFDSGRYRSSDVYLAVKPAAKLAEPGGLLFYAGGLGQPQWSHDEDSAVPLFGEGCIGELSTRWNPLLGAWTCLRRTEHGVQTYFTMSTWNPYQVMLMTVGIPTPLSHSAWIHRRASSVDRVATGNTL